jgi:hypothetical protein
MNAKSVVVIICALGVGVMQVIVITAYTIVSALKAKTEASSSKVEGEGNLLIRQPRKRKGLF